MVSSVFIIPLAVISAAVVAPVALKVVAVSACAAIVLPDSAVNVFAVNVKSSAPAILK